MRLIKYMDTNYSVVTDSDSDRIIKSCFTSFSPVGWLLTVGSLAHTMTQETDGINYRPGTPTNNVTTYHTWRTAHNKTTCIH